jgi:hypothetical protein
MGLVMKKNLRMEFPYLRNVGHRSVVGLSFPAVFHLAVTQSVADRTTQCSLVGSPFSKHIGPFLIDPSKIDRLSICLLTCAFLTISLGFYRGAAATDAVNSRW